MEQTTNGTAAYVTAVSELKGDFATLHGYRVDDLAAHVTFTDACFLAMTGELPNSGQRAMLDHLFVLETAHGVAPTGALARSYISCGSPIQVALAAGALAVGDVHGGAGEQVGQLLQEHGVALARQVGVAAAAKTLIDELLQETGRAPGFGHQWHKDGDPRAGHLLEAAGQLQIAGTACELLQAMEDALANAKGRRIPANVDGAIAAILTDMGIDWRFSRPIMILTRTMTLAALAIEEMQHRSRDWRALMVPAEKYVGQPERPVIGTPAVPGQNTAAGPVDGA